MVGIAIGLLVVAVAMSALMISRGVSGTVSDASGIQQQSAYVMRVIGLQLRQAGSLYLNLNSTNAPTDQSAAAPVAFETRSGDLDLTLPSWRIIEGKDNPGASEFKLTTRFSNYTEPLFLSATPQSQVRDCIGASPSTTLIESKFKFVNNELQCASFGSTAAQAIAQNVANFQLRYLLQNNAAANNPTLQYVAANAVEAAGGWGKVQAVEVCLVLYGTEPIDLPTGSTYTDCDGTTAVDMSNAAATDMSGTAIGAQRARRMHIVYRNVFQLRSQGLVGTVL